MAPARWKDLCIDAHDALVVGRWWADVLGFDLERQAGGDTVLRGDRPEETIWVNRVPEAKAGKNRVHLDLAGIAVDRLVGLGGSVLGDEVRPGPGGWTVLADPEGNELCAFGADAPSALVVDSTDPIPLAAWWAEVLGARLVPAPNGEPRWLADVPGLPWDRLKVVGVPEPRTVKNRLHWDVTSTDVDALVVRGATVLERPRRGADWTVLADPQGNEFCAFAP